MLTSYAPIRGTQTVSGCPGFRLLLVGSGASENSMRQSSGSARHWPAVASREFVAGHPPVFAPPALHTQSPSAAVADPWHSGMLQACCCWVPGREVVTALSQAARNTLGLGEMT